nr:uncharacterized protein LOC129434237 [Misgurnus anguillicaudatus]
MTQMRQELTRLLRTKCTLKNKRKIVLWMQAKGLLRRHMQCRCNNMMHLIKVSRHDGYQWICRRHRDRAASVRKGTIFYRSRRSLQNHLEFIYRFSQGLRMRQIDLMEDGVAASSKTLSKMASVMRQVCCRAINKLRSHGKMRVGGRHSFVMLDESKFSHKRKYNRGRIGPAWRRTKKWVLGILEISQTTRRPILKIVRGRSRNDLMPAIIRHVRRGTSIVTDEWRAYRRSLVEEGYNHHTVCHKRHFVHPTTRAHTQHLERAWQTYKTDVWRHRGNRTTKLLKEHLRVIEWEYWLARNHIYDILGRLIHDIRKFNVHEFN